MHYLGGKAKLARDIARVIHSREGSWRRYVEPFMGGGSTFAAISPYFAESCAGDMHADLVMMWTAAAQGWVPPTKVTLEEYQFIRRQPSSHLRGFVCFACSFGGKWNSGYARHERGNNDSKFAELYSAQVVEKAATMRNTIIRRQSYDMWDVGANDVVYCDPPYNMTSGYSTGRFYHGKFWNVMKVWAMRGAHVYVSEINAPSGWEVVWSKRRNETLSTTSSGPALQENLFYYNGWSER